jgi:hypothetical protein
MVLSMAASSSVLRAGAAQSTAMRMIIGRGLIAHSSLRADPKIPRFRPAVQTPATFEESNQLRTKYRRMRYFKIPRSGLALFTFDICRFLPQPFLSEKVFQSVDLTILAQKRLHFISHLR